jgi:hypothetical protein
MRLDPEVLDAAKERAAADNRSLTNYVETLLRRDLRIGAAGSAFEVIAPENIRQSAAAPVPGETEQERKRRDEVFRAVLDASGR